ncbi:ABC transporter substrate-binding protein [Frigidibacter sp. MR17.24]|uniref:ABC transporter substrate-binding protein n=1 Tax=Frigidibacter sp. MR17.24 TaxID=3127345 RepID=UPI003013116A
MRAHSLRRSPAPASSRLPNRAPAALPAARPVTLALALAALLAPCAPAQAEGTRYPLEIDNCGHPLRFDGPPGNVVSIGQATTEILYALGVADRMAGTALWFNDVLPAYRDVDAGVPRIADNAPGFEAVVNRRPGFVPTMFEWMIGPQGAVGTRAQFADLGIPAYVMPTDCEAKDNLTGSDGTRSADFDVATLYRSIEEMAAIMDRPARGAEIVADLKARAAAAVGRAQALSLPDASAVVWFSSADLDLDPFVAGQRGIPAWMMRQLGLRNVVQSDEEWPTVGWETIARADPSVIVLARMDRRRFPADDVDKKLAFLASDPVTREMTAVREGRIVILDAQQMEASIRVVDGLETLTAAMQTLAP